ncbi:hypothetical protein CRM22_002477 [Opisthorchis felineus]|uniref:Protein NDRG3 n=1 Tax=Opisthorchis felineus TaxID=147828 RepID=A0A4S2MC95_OPIFE|nr:hypothetical protein CRM22_002477 [Opisthorchis felineus]
MEVPLVEFQGATNLHHRGPNAPLFSGSTSCGEEFSGGMPLHRTAPQLEEHEILTSTGVPQRVYVQRGHGKLALLTYHDIGTNHTSFLGFFNHPDMRVITKHFVVYHVCAPGHHENAPNVSLEVPSRHFRRLLSDAAATNHSQSLLIDKECGREKAASTVSPRASHPTLPMGRAASSEVGLHYPNLDQLAQMLTSVVVHFGIDYFVGFGMGAGSNVLSRYALHHPDNVLALFLLNPTVTTHTYYQKYRCLWWDIPYLKQGVLTDYLLEQLDAHWFGYGLAENEDILHFYHQLARSLNPLNLAGYIRAFIDRTEINLIRPIGPAMPGEPEAPESEPTVIKTDVCLVTGHRAVDLCRILEEMNGQMDPKKTQFLTIPDCTGMVMEEDPDKLAVDFLHFLRSIGLLINLTPEKLHQQATLLLQQQSQLEAGTKLDVANEV